MKNGQTKSQSFAITFEIHYGNSYQNSLSPKNLVVMWLELGISGRFVYSLIVEPALPRGLFAREVALEGVEMYTQGRDKPKPDVYHTTKSSDGFTDLFPFDVTSITCPGT